MLEEVFIALSIMVGLGLFFATILTIAYKKMKVYEDPRIDKVEDLLPSANCGACGEPGCRAFAEKVVNNELNVGKCTVSPPSGIDAIAGFLGIEANKEEKRVIRRVKNFRSRGWSWRKISDRLNGDGVKSKEDKIWYDGSLYNMMRNYS